LLALPAGSWLLRYRWFETEIRDWVELEFSIAVADLGQNGEPSVAEILDSDCLMETSVPEHPGSSKTWTTLKALYR